MALLLVVLALATSIVASEPSGNGNPCQPALSSGPRVPAALVFRTSCGGFRLARDGTLTHLPQRWFDVRSSGTGRRYGADLRIWRTRAGAIILLGGKRIVWRSAARYRNDAGSVAFGPRAFAFAAYRRGVYVTDLRSPERLIARGVGLEPVAFLGDGTLLVADWNARAILRTTQRGSLVARYEYRLRNGFVYDQRTETVYLVTPESNLVRVTATGSATIRSLGHLDGMLAISGRHLTLHEFRHRGRSDEIGLAVLRRDGRFVSSFRWRSPKGASIDVGALPSADGRSFALRTVTRQRSKIVVYVLTAGRERPVAVFRHRGAQIGCGVGATFSWNDRFLLYAATDGPAAVVDSRSGHALSLAQVMRDLPVRAGGAVRVHWESDFPSAA
jgi:hypothetical protein